MATATVIYLGSLRTEMTHLRSGNKVITDAPTDNQGKGEAFSPTDIVSAALCSCMLTIMGQVAQRENIALEGMTGEAEKIMSAVSPRKIAEVKITLRHPNLKIDDKQRQKLINAAHTCPVALSLSADVKQTIVFEF
ncbi:MAG: osmotically inducible protein OsmC [Candidatus Nephrothrix sp. EaCA]|nr:MAG: osmotically inducible protein OsmC [Candidatus Nephrothrix sp. EaCA]